MSVSLSFNFMILIASQTRQKYNTILQLKINTYYKISSTLNQTIFD